MNTERLSHRVNGVSFEKLPVLVQKTVFFSFIIHKEEDKQ